MPDEGRPSRLNGGKTRLSAVDRVNDLVGSEFSEQNQDQQDHDHEPKPATAIVAGPVKGTTTQAAKTAE